jgi:hypothetical protein
VSTSWVLTIRLALSLWKIQQGIDTFFNLKNGFYTPHWYPD